jgi:hypothetical protein
MNTTDPLAQLRDIQLPEPVGLWPLAWGWWALLLLVVGELDTNVDPASTMQVASALVKANKTFDLLLIPGAGHAAGRRDGYAAYGERKRFDFFVQHLRGETPPHWNGEHPVGTA